MDDLSLAVESQCNDYDGYGSSRPDSDKDRKAHSRATVLSIHIAGCGVKMLLGYAE